MESTLAQAASTLLPVLATAALPGISAAPSA
jgi:hypothetical protein